MNLRIKKLDPQIFQSEVRTFSIKETPSRPYAAHCFIKKNLSIEKNNLLINKAVHRSSKQTGFKIPPQILENGCMNLNKQTN